MTINSFTGISRLFKRVALLKTLIAALSSILLATSSGAAQDADNLAQIEKGREAFLTAGGVGCAACHGPYAEGDVGIGPYNRGIGEDGIRAALKSIEAMAFLRDELTDAEIRGIAAYYELLGELKLVKTLAKRGRFIPDQLEVYPGTKVQLVVQNASSLPHTFTSANHGLGFDKITVEGREDLAITWQAPQSEGTFTLECTDCKIKGEKLTVVVTDKAPKFISAKAAPKVLASAAPMAPQNVTLSPSEQDLAAKGLNIFLNIDGVGCVACHGRFAEGDVGIGPYNRGFSEAAIRNALKNVTPMAFLNQELNEEKIKQVAAYYRSLAHMRLVKTRVIRGMFVPDIVKVHPGTTVQLVVFNSSTAPRTFASEDMAISQLRVPGRDFMDIEWVAPKSPGTFTFACKDCQIKGQKLTIEVTESVPPYSPPVILK